MTKPATDTPPIAAALWFLIGLCCLLPLIWMLWQTLASPRALIEIRWSSFRAGLLGRTILYNGAAAGLATLMAWPAAIVVGRGRGGLARILLILLPLAVMMPSITYTYGWMQVFRLMGISFAPAGAADVLRCIWVLACWLWPLPAITMGLALRCSDSQVQQQALLDGALWRVTLRQLMVPLAGSLAVVMVLAMQEFAVYERSGISVMATEIRTVFETGAIGSSSQAITDVVGGTGRIGEGQGERAAAAVATAIPMLLIIVALSLLAIWSLRRFSSSEAMETGAWPSILNARWPSIATTTLLLLLTLILPTAAMVVSLKRSIDPLHTWDVLGPQVTGSIFIGLLSGLAAFGIGLLATIRRSRPLLAIALMTFLIGGELLAIADIRIYNRALPGPLGVRVFGHDLFGWIYNYAPVMVIAYIGRFGWLALLAGQLTWSGSMSPLRSMAAVDGATPWQTARHVVWPIAWPILAASAVLVLILAMTEVPATVLLSPQRPQMLVPMLMGWVHMLRYDDMLEGSLLLMGVVMALGLGFVMLVTVGLRLMGKQTRNGAGVN